MGSRLKKKKKTFGHELLQVGYWEQLVGHIVIFTASLVNQILHDKLREYKAFSSSPYVVGLKSIVKADKIQSSTQRHMYLLLSPTIQSCFDQVVELLMVLVSLRGSVMDDRPRESMQYLVYIKQGTWYLQYLVLGIWCFKYFTTLHQTSCSQ